MARKRDILALERRVKEVYAQDKSSPEMYTSIKELAEAILVVKNMAYNSTEVDEISHMLATDFYIKLNHEGMKVEKWTKYIRLRLYRMRSDYLKETQGVELQIDDPIEAEEFAERCLGGYYQSISSEVEMESVLDSLPEIFFQIYDKYVRYTKSSEEYRLVRLSLMFTLERRILTKDNNVVVLIGLDYTYESYITFLINLIYKRIGVYLHKILGEDLSRSSEMRELIGASWNIDNCE